MDSWFLISFLEKTRIRTCARLHILVLVWKNIFFHATRCKLRHDWSRGGNSQQFLAVQIFERCPDFHFYSKRKSGRPDFWKGVHIFNFFKSQIWPSRFLERCSHLRFWWKSKCEHLFCTDLDRKGVHILIFIKNENVNTFPKIWTARFAFWKKKKMWTRISVRPVQICDLK